MRDVALVGRQPVEALTAPTPTDGHRGRARDQHTARVAALLALTLVAFGLRMVRLAYFNLSGDESVTATFSLQPLSVIIQALRNGEPHPPLFYVLYHVWIPAAGDSEIALRFFSVAVGTALVPLVFATGARLLSRPVGSVAAALVAVNPYQLWNAQDARMYTLATWLCLAALLATADIVGPCPSVRRRGDGPADRRSLPLLRAVTDQRHPLVLYMVCMALALYTHYYSVYLFVAFNLYALARFAWARDAVVARPVVRSSGRPVPTTTRRVATAQWSHRRHAVPFRALFRTIPAWLLPWIVAQCVVAIVYAPWLALGWHTITTYHGNGYSPSLIEAVRRAVGTFIDGYVLGVDETGPVFWLSVALFLAGTVLAVRRAAWAALLLLLSLLVLPAGVFVASLARPVFNERYLIAASPAFSVLIAAAVLGAERTRSRLTRALAIAGVVLLAVVSTWLLARYETSTTTIDKGRDASRFGAFLAAHVTPNDRVIFNTVDPEFAYYYRRASGRAPTIVAPNRLHETEAELDRQLTTGLARSRFVWLVVDGVHRWDPTGRVPAWLDRHEVHLRDLYEPFHLIVYRVLSPSTPLTVRFGPEIDLVGADLPRGNHVRVGQSLPVRLFWRTRAPLLVSYTVSVQLLDAAGHLVAQQDSLPDAGAAPTTSWRTTETLPDRHLLEPVPPLVPGRYTVAVAVYELQTLHRLPVVGEPDGLAPIASMTVTP